MDKKMRHIADIAETRSQTKGQMAESLYWISKLATADLDEIANNEEYMEHLESLDLGICHICKVTILADEVLCEDCYLAENENWSRHSEEVGNAHMVSVGVA